MLYLTIIYNEAKQDGLHLDENMRHVAMPGQHICFKLSHAGQPYSTNTKIMCKTAKCQRKKSSKGN